MNNLLLLSIIKRIVMQLKQQRNKAKTLCTIDTIDIDFQQSKPPTDNPALPSTKNPKQKYPQSSYIQRKYLQRNHTPSRTNYQKFFRTQKLGINLSNSKSKSKNKIKSGLHFKNQGYQIRINTDYDRYQQHDVKSLMGRKSKSSKKKIGSMIQEGYRLDTYQIIDIIDENSKQKIYKVKKFDKVYIMKKTKKTQIKKQYQNQSKIKARLIHIKWKNLSKIIKIYQQKNWMYAIYDDYGQCLSWNNVIGYSFQNSHCQVVEKILKYDGIVLKYIIKQIAKGINQLSSKGFVHSFIRFENISLKIQQLKTTIKIEGNVRLCNLGYAFSIKDKIKLISLPQEIYTPPELINLKLFEKGQKFDRQLIEYINCYDEPWLIDIWALGVLILELIAGETISIQKAQSPPQRSDEISLDLQNQIDLKKVAQTHQTKQITLTDILQAQKSLLSQTELQIQKLQFDKKLQNLVLRMLSVNPLNRPSPKQIIKDL